MLTLSIPEIITSQFRFVAIFLGAVFAILFISVLHRDFVRARNKLRDELQYSFEEWEPTIDIENISVLGKLPNLPEIDCKFAVIYRKMFSSAETISIWPCIQMNPPLFRGQEVKKNNECFWRSEQEIQVNAGESQNGEILLSLNEINLKEYVKNFRQLKLPKKREFAEESLQEVSLSLQLYFQREIDDIKPVYSLRIQPVPINFPSRSRVFRRIVATHCFKKIPAGKSPFLVNVGDRYSIRCSSVCFLTEKFIGMWGDDEKRESFRLDLIMEDMARLICDEILRNESFADCCIEKFPLQDNKWTEEDKFKPDPMNDPELINRLLEKIEESGIAPEKAREKLYIGIFQTENIENYILKENARGIFLFGIPRDENINCVFDLSNRELYRNCNLDLISEMPDDKDEIILKKILNCMTIPSEREISAEMKDKITNIAKNLNEQGYYQTLKQFTLEFSEVIVFYGGFINSVPEFSRSWINIDMFNKIIEEYEKGQWFKNILEKIVCGYLRCHEDSGDFIVLNLCSEETTISDRALEFLYNWKFSGEKSVPIYEVYYKDGWHEKPRLPKDKKAIIVTAFDSHVKELRELVAHLRRYPNKIEPCVLIPIFSLVDFQSEINKYRYPGKDIDIDVLPLFILKNYDLLVSRRIREIEILGEIQKDL